MISKMFSLPSISALE
jgi:MFS family permease